MDYYQFAVTDWEVYQDQSRIAVYVDFGKITPEQYKGITGESYVG